MKKSNLNHGHRPKNVLRRKIFRTMKLTLFLVLGSVIQLLATNSYSQTTLLNLEKSNATVEEVLTSIENQSEFYFLYNVKLIDVNRKVNINIRNKKVEDVLSDLFEGTGVRYQVFDRQIVLSPEEILFENDQQVRISVKGIVSSTKGEPLPGVTVVIKGSNTGTITDANGMFSLPNTNPEATLLFSYIGMITQEVEVENRTNLNVVLIEDAIGVDEVIVVGYGLQKKANLTGSISSSTGTILNSRPVTNSANLLQGRMPGLNVITPSAEPGRDNPTFLIRGRGSFGGSNDPLILIDGVTGSLNNLDPNDIENVTVLKDAASASIYGARAANGVILVTTKKGKKGDMTINYRGNLAIHTPTALPDLITNSAEYMEMFNTAAARSGVAFRYADSEIEKYRNATDREQYPNFDFIDYYFNPALVTNHNLSVSGGNEKNTYNFSVGYLNQNAMIEWYKFKKYNVLLNYTTEFNKSITFGTSMNMTYKDRHEPPFTGELMALTIYAAGPLYGPFLPDGSGRVVSRAYLNEGRNRSPQEYALMGKQDTKEYNLNAQAYLDIKLLPNLIWSSKVAINYVDEYYKMHQQPYSAYLLQETDPTTGDYKMATYGPDILGVTDQYSKNITPTIFSTLTYDTEFGKDHSFKALLGYEQLSYQYQVLRARRINTVDYNISDLKGYTADNQSLFFTHPRLPSLTEPTQWAMQSFFGRINYDFKNRYLVEANLRYDGTSKVSPDYRWGLFPSMSAGWLISEESFIKDQAKWINNLKARLSYGTLGNQDVGTYLYQDILTISGIYYPFDNKNLSQGAVLNSFRDQSLKWESTRILDLGFDFVMKDGLLGITFDWFNKTTFDILAAQPVPASLGLTQPTLNDGIMENKGIELQLSHQKKIGEFSYGANLLFSMFRNKLLHIKTPSKGTTINEEGLPYGSFYLYEWDGIFQVEDINNPDVPKHAKNPNPKAGDLKMKDQTNDKIIDESDRIVVDGVYPDFTYSLGFNLGYKNFNLTGFFQGVQGIKSRVYNWGVDPFMQGTAPTTEWRNAWTEENRSNTLPAIYCAGYAGVANYQGSTYYLKDASYLRLKNIQLTYSFPTNVVSKIKMKGLDVYLSGDNLLTLTKYKGSDPERASSAGNFSQYPQARIMNIGINVKF